jgi:hypothetical protein
MFSYNFPRIYPPGTIKIKKTRWTRGSQSVKPLRSKLLVESGLPRLQLMRALNPPKSSAAAATAAAGFTLHVWNLSTTGQLTG